MNGWDQSEWRRLHDGPMAAPIVPMPLRHYHPTTRYELLEIVRDVEKMTGPGGRPPEVRAVGSGWALSEAAVTPDVIVETHGLNRTLYDVVPGCLTKGTFMDLIGRIPKVPLEPNAADTESSYLYHVEAGTRIYEVYCRLDTHDTDPRSLASVLANVPNLPQSWALPTMGGAGGQTIVGAFSTGTHGGDWQSPPLADAVEAIHLIGPGAQEYWTERIGARGPLTKDAGLRGLYPGITIVRDPDFFNAVLVSVGRLMDWGAH